jgi:hypothetical protein
MTAERSIPCECTEHACVPVPVQHVRYRIRRGPGAEGIVMLCAHCFINAHMASFEFTWQAHNRPAKEAASNG